MVGERHIPCPNVVKKNILFVILAGDMGATQKNRKKKNNNETVHQQSAACCSQSRVYERYDLKLQQKAGSKQQSTKHTTWP